MDIFYLVVFIFSVAFTWVYGGVVDEYKEKIKKLLDKKD